MTEQKKPWGLGKWAIRIVKGKFEMYTNIPSFTTWKCEWMTLMIMCLNNSDYKPDSQFNYSQQQSLIFLCYLRNLSKVYPMKGITANRFSSYKASYLLN